MYEDRVPETRVLFAWNTPQFGSREDLHFDLISAILTSGKNSRLYRKFVYEDQSASAAVSFQASGEIASRFMTYLNVKPGQDYKVLEEELWAEISKFIEEGPTENELNRVKAAFFANFIKGLERIGGFGGVSDILASNQSFHGDASYYKTQLKFVEDATAEDIRNTARKWLTQGKHILVCKPFPDYTVETSAVDRSRLPELGPQKSSKFPELQRTSLSNGLNVVLAQRSGVPTIIMNLVSDAGYKTDYLSSPGTAQLAMNLMDEGTKDKNSLQINEELQLLGASLSTFSDQDQSNVYMSTLKPSFDASLDLYADVILNPEFPTKEFEQINAIRQEKSQPVSMALRVMNKYLYGEDHPYSSPYTGTGYEESVQELTREDIVAFYNSWIKPNNSTLIVTGDISMDELKPKLEKALGRWKKGEVPQVTFNAPKTNTKNTLYLMNRPESKSSVIIAGHLTDKYGGVSEVALEQMVSILVGDFTSRINMNLREDKHWSYGAGGFVLGSKEERPFILFAQVQTDKTAESVTELQKEITDFISTRPPTQEELDKVKTNQVLKLPGQWETNSAVNGSVRNLLRYDLPDDYYQTYDQSVRDLSLTEVRGVSQEVVRPEEVNWFMVGDRAEIIAKLDQLGFDNIIEIDADGNPLLPAMTRQEPDIKN